MGVPSSQGNPHRTLYLPKKTTTAAAGAVDELTPKEAQEGMIFKLRWWKGSPMERRRCYVSRCEYKERVRD